MIFLVIYIEKLEQKLIKDIELISQINRSIQQNKKVGMEGGRAPIVARYCSPFGHLYNELLKSTAANNYNKTVACDIIDD